MARRKHPTFRSWLEAELAKQGLPRREVARRLAAKHPRGATTDTIETYRRAIYRYLDPVAPMIPNAQTRAAFADALGVKQADVPAEDEEDELDLVAAVQSMTRDLKSLRKALRVAKA